MKKYIAIAAILIAASITAKAQPNYTEAATFIDPGHNATGLTHLDFAFATPSAFYPFFPIAGTALDGHNLLVDIFTVPGTGFQTHGGTFSMTLNIQTDHAPTGSLSLGDAEFFTTDRNGTGGASPGITTAGINGFSVTQMALGSPFEDFGGMFFITLPNDPGNTITGADISFDGEPFDVQVQAPDTANTLMLTACSLVGLAGVRGLGRKARA